MLFLHVDWHFYHFTGNQLDLFCGALCCAWKEATLAKSDHFIKYDLSTGAEGLNEEKTQTKGKF